jgi:hypothetical protein
MHFRILFNVISNELGNFLADSLNINDINRRFEQIVCGIYFVQSVVSLG